PHLGVATDHVIESFRNGLWRGYKTSEGMEPALLAQFHPLEDALAAMGVTVWPMVELEADDALAAAAHSASADARVEKVCIWTPDKGLAQCVRGEGAVQMDRKANKMRDEAAVRDKYGVEPRRIADLLALVGDAADGYPGIAGIGEVTAARLINRYGAIEDFPAEILAGERRAPALLFKRLAALKTGAPRFAGGKGLRWLRPTGGFARRAAPRARTPSASPAARQFLAPHEQLVAIRAARMFDSRTGSLVANPVIVVRGERIAEVGSGTAVPAGASVVDLGSATVLPGMIDGHVHLNLNQPLPPARRALIALANAQVDLEAGFTTVLDMDSRGGFNTVEIRD